MSARGAAGPAATPRRRIGWLADLETLAHNPERLARLQDQLGITTVWLESGRYHTAGYRLSEAAWASSPFQDWRTQPGLARHRQIRRLPETSFPVLPGILAGADEADLLAVIDNAGRLGIELWGHLGFWSYGGMVYPDLAVRDLAQCEIPSTEDRWGACFCPSKDALNDWLVTCVRDCAARYPLQGMEVDHARYIPPHSLPNLLTCACPDCARQAAVWGIDAAGLAQHFRAALARMQAAPAGDIAAALQTDGTLIDAMDTLVHEQAASRWFTLRARYLTTTLEKAAVAAQQSAPRPFDFGIDVLPPSVALLTGHHYAELGCLDYFTGGFGYIGWERAGVSTAVVWAKFLLAGWPELDEAFVMAQLLRLAGLAGLPLAEPMSVLEKPPALLLAQLEAREIERAAAMRPAGMPVYPPVSLPAIGADGLAIVSRAVAEHGLDGVIVAGLENLTPDQDQRVAEALRPLAQ